MMDQKDFEMANGKYSSTATDWRNDPYYFSAVNLDRDVPEHDEEEDEEDEEQDDLEDDTHDGGSHDESEGDDDWSGFDEDDD
jgi:hypothetical protein